MCGIAGFHSLTGAPPVRQSGLLADELLLSIQDRGRDATGLLTITNEGESTLIKRPVPAWSFTRSRGRFPAPRTALLHTRWATTGVRNSTRDAHPQVSGSMAAIHNGTITNADRLFETFGLERKNKVDSEVIPAMIDFAGWDKAENALALMSGGCATAVTRLDEPGDLLLARLRSFPLAYAVIKEQGLLVFASTEHAIRQAWHHAYDEALPGKVEHLGYGECVRANGKVELTTIPGVHGVEREYHWQPPSGKGKGEAKKASSRRRRRAAKKSTTYEDLMAEHRRSGSQHTAAEVDRLLGQLAKIERSNNRLKGENARLRDERDGLAEDLAIAKMELDLELVWDEEDGVLWEGDQLVDAT